MTFPSPSTKEEMYQILEQIFNYYRVDANANILQDLKDLELQRLEFSPKTSEQLKLKASELLSYKHANEQSQLNSEILQKISQEEISLESKIKSINQKIDLVQANFSSQSLSLKKEAQKKNLDFSDLYLERLTRLEKERDNQVNELQGQLVYEQENSSRIIAQLNEGLNSQLLKLKELQEIEILVKAKELLDEQDKLERETFKYNNQLDEKEQRYSNSIQQTRVSFRIKLIEAQGEEFTESELIEKGYYSAVVKCVYGYYDRLPPIQAYEEFLNDYKVMPYLEKFYDQALSRFRARSLDS